MLDYNTLVKAIAYRELKGADLSIDYKNAFETMQKKLITASSYQSTADLCSNKVLNEPCKLYGHNSNIITKDYFNDEIAYNEMREELLSLELYLSLSFDVYSKILKENLDFSNLDRGDLDAALLSYSKSFVNEHEEAYVSKYKHLMDNINHKPAKSLNFLFEDTVKQRYKLGGIEHRYDYMNFGRYYKNILTEKKDLNMLDRIVGYGPNNKKLVFNSYKDFVNMQNYHPKKSIFS